MNSKLASHSGLPGQLLLRNLNPPAALEDPLELDVRGEGLCLRRRAARLVLQHALVSTDRQRVCGLDQNCRRLARVPRMPRYQTAVCDSRN